MILLSFFLHKLLFVFLNPLDVCYAFSARYAMNFLDG